MHSFTQNLRHAARMLWSNPGFSATALICLALGVGATTGIFSVVKAVVLRPLPYREPERLVRLYTEFPTFPNGGLKRFWVSPPEWLDLRRDTRSWESLEAWVTGSANMSGSVRPVRLAETYVTGGMFRMLGARTELGRTITEAEDSPTAPLTAVISDNLWRTAFAADPSAVGRDVLLDGQKATVIGVMPKDFQFPPGEAEATQIWVHAQIDPAHPGGRGSHFLSVIGRLAPGVTLRRAQQELAQMVNRDGATAGPQMHSFSPKFHPLSSYLFQDEVVGAIRPALWALFGAVVFVLLIACVNVANLLLARAEARQREVAIRRAIGASLGLLTRQFLVEGLLLALSGCIPGLLLAFTGLKMLKALGESSIPRAAEIGMDGGVLGFALTVTLCTGVFFGLSPVLQFAGQELYDTLKAAGSRTTATAGAQLLRRVLVVGELALALALLTGTGLMIRTFWNLQRVDAGVEPAGVLTMRVLLPPAVYQDARSLTAFWSEAQERLRALPNVASVTIASGLPPVRRLNANDTNIEGFVTRPNGPIQNVDYWQVVGDNYFRTMGVRLIEGRFFDERDGKDAPRVAIVNLAMARHFWPGQSPIGRRVQLGGAKDWLPVVGVVGDVKNAGIDKPAGTELYIPYQQAEGIARYLSIPTVFLRSKGDDPMLLAEPARRVMQGIDPNLPVAYVRTMDEVIDRAEARPRLLTTLLTLFGVTAVILAAIGVYGVISYAVSRRTAEIGVRMAMGANRGNVMVMVLGQGMRLALAGIVVGAVGAVLFARWIHGLLFGVSALDPATFVVTGIAMLVVVLIACAEPARRATRVDPVVALRYE